MLLIGSHVNYNKETQLLGCVEQAVSYNATAFMFYTGAPQNTARSVIDDNLIKKAYVLMKNSDIDINNVIVHAPYIINLCNEKNFDFSVNFLTEEVKRCQKYGVKKIVLHPGSHIGIGVDKGIENIVKGINQVISNFNGDMPITILLETMAGKGTEIGRTIEEIKNILNGIINSNNVGVCLDTCHLNDAGYDMSKFNEFLDEFDKIIGIDKIGCIHLNDSKNELNAHKDRHENIGFGTIGFNNLINIIYNKRLENIPKILETPYIDRKYPPYKYEIEMIRNKSFDCKLIEKINMSH